MAWSPVSAPSGGAVNTRGFVSAYQFSPSGAVTPTGGGGSVGGAAMGGGQAPIRPPLAGSVQSSATPSNLNYTPSLSGSGGSAGLPVPTGTLKPGSTPTPMSGGQYNNWQPVNRPTWPSTSLTGAGGFSGFENRPPVDMAAALGSGGLSVPQQPTLTGTQNPGVELSGSGVFQARQPNFSLSTGESVYVDPSGNMFNPTSGLPIAPRPDSSLQRTSVVNPPGGAGAAPTVLPGGSSVEPPPPMLPPDPQTMTPYYMPSYQSPSSMAGGMVSSYATPGGSGYGGPSGSGTFGIENQGKRKKGARLGFGER